MNCCSCGCILVWTSEGLLERLILSLLTLPCYRTVYLSILMGVDETSDLRELLPVPVYQKSILNQNRCYLNMLRFSPLFPGKFYPQREVYKLILCGLLAMFSKEPVQKVHFLHWIALSLHLNSLGAFASCTERSKSLCGCSLMIRTSAAINEALDARNKSLAQAMIHSRID